MTRRWMMTPLALCVFSMLLVGCGSTQQSQTSSSVELGESGTSPMSILAHYRGNQQGLTEPGYWLINSEQELERFGGAALTDGQAVDFAEHSLLLFALGQQPSGGYWARIDAVQVKGNALFFQGTANRPGPDDMVTQALTFPYAAALLPKVQATRVHPEIDSVEGQRSAGN